MPRPNVVALPIPPLELRELVGPTDPADYDNASGDPVIPGVPSGDVGSVLDFGCGCGRLARQLIQQRPQPHAYLGLDLHKGMIEWSRRNLSPHATGFVFEHHDVHNASFNPDAPRDQTTVAFPLEEETIDLVIACSVFTHLVEDQIVFYLDQVSRILRRRGHFYSTWFLFDKSAFPMMQSFQNCLYINAIDPTNAVIVDREWLLERCRERGLVVVQAQAPKIQGFQWHLRMRRPGLDAEIDLPPDLAPIGLARPALVRPGAAHYGLEDAGSDG